MTSRAEVSASLEDYLEAIFHVVAQKRVARPRDISRRLRVNASSVTSALRALSDRGLIHYEPYEAATLTDQGRALAVEVVRRHRTLHDFLVRVLKIDEREAEACACKMEHEVPSAVLERLIQFIEFVKNCPQWEAEWSNGFGYHCSNGAGRENCDRCQPLSLERPAPAAPGNGRAPQLSIPLSDLGPGAKGRILRIRPSGEVTRRILDMGVTPGTVIEIERVAPLGDPIDIKVKGYHLSLRKEEAANIRVEPV